MRITSDLLYYLAFGMLCNASTPLSRLNVLLRWTVLFLTSRPDDVHVDRGESFILDKEHLKVVSNENR